jgi:hypothetical protein
LGCVRTSERNGESTRVGVTMTGSDAADSLQVCSALGLHQLHCIYTTPQKVDCQAQLHLVYMSDVPERYERCLCLCPEASHPPRVLHHHCPRVNLCGR